MTVYFVAGRRSVHQALTLYLATGFIVRVTEVMSIKPLTRGQVAASAGLDIETVRFYEKRGLIDDPPRSKSGY